MKRALRVFVYALAMLVAGTLIGTVGYVFLLVLAAAIDKITVPIIVLIFILLGLAFEKEITTEIRKLRNRKDNK